MHLVLVILTRVLDKAPERCWWWGACWQGRTFLGTSHSVSPSCQVTGRERERERQKSSSKVLVGESRCHSGFRTGHVGQRSPWHRLRCILEMIRGSPVHGFTGTDVLHCHSTSLFVHSVIVLHSYGPSLVLKDPNSLTAGCSQTRKKSRKCT